MRKILAFLFSFCLVFADSLEIKGNLEETYVLPSYGNPSDVTIFQGKFGGGLGGSANACGLQAGLNFFYGLKTSLEGLMEFINDWKSSATALALYALATYLPVAKEALLGANTLSNFLARLRGFSCSQAMQAIKEFNYTDSWLIKKCIARKLGIEEDEVDSLKETSPSEWYSVYRSCLNSASLTDLLGNEGALKFVKFISPRSYVKCALGVKDNISPEEIANADVYTKAKYFLYLITPDVQLSSDGLLQIKTVKIKDSEGNIRPATLADMVKLYRDQFEEDYENLVEEIKSLLSSESLESAIPSIEAKLDEFGRKYGLDLRNVKYLFGLVGKLYMENKKLREENKLSVTEAGKELKALSLMEKELKDFLLAEAIHRLRLAIEDASLRVAETLKTAKATGSVSQVCGGSE